MDRAQPGRRSGHGSVGQRLTGRAGRVHSGGGGHLAGDLIDLVAGQPVEAPRVCSGRGAQVEARGVAVDDLTRVDVDELDGYDHNMVYPALPLVLKEVERILNTENKK